MPNVESLHKDVDIVFLREVTEGMQSSDTVVAGTGEFRPNDEITIAHRIITRTGLQSRGSRRVRDRADAQAQESHCRAQGARVPPRVRHVRRGVP